MCMLYYTIELNRYSLKNRDSDEKKIKFNNGFNKSIYNRKRQPSLFYKYKFLMHMNFNQFL